ncbi:hypothetical protein J7L05_12655 [bacterium]|nr:hypothetical protein [bacterium]
MFKLKTLSLFLVVAVFAVIISCQSKHSPLTPLLPGESAYTNEKGANDSNFKLGDCHQKYVFKISKTGPAEYFASELSPPILTNNLPVFSAHIETNLPVSNTDFYATVDEERFECSLNLSAKQISFAAPYPLGDGNHHVEIIFHSKDGLFRNYGWDFTVLTTPPEIERVLWHKNENAITVWFDRKVEPSVLKDTSRWSLNG